MFWEKLLAAIFGGLLVMWLLFTVKRSPDAFSKANLSKSFTTFAVLALLFIALVALCVMILRAS